LVGGWGGLWRPPPPPPPRAPWEPLQGPFPQSAGTGRLSAVCCCAAVSVLQGIIYRDVKPDNFLFLTTEPDSPLKATDFGLSIRHASHEPKLTSRSGEALALARGAVSAWSNSQEDILGSCRVSATSRTFRCKGSWQAVLLTCHCRPPPPAH
jgi:serine/threonine protein kinase